MIEQFLTSRSISVSETVRTLTELRHTPASPSLLRRKIAAQAQAQAQVQAQASSSGDGKALARASSSGASAVLQIACCAMERASMAIRYFHWSSITESFVVFFFISRLTLFEFIPEK